MADGDTVVVEVKGLSQLKARLVALPVETQGKPLFDALFAAAAPIVSAAKDLAPKDTGNLASKIRAFRQKTSEHDAEVDVGVKGGRVSKGAGQRGDRSAYYWRFIEFGHRTRGSEPRNTKAERAPHEGDTVVPPRPFLRPAFEGQKTQALERFRLTLAASIEAIRARLVGA